MRSLRNASTLKPSSFFSRDVSAADEVDVLRRDCAVSRSPSSTSFSSPPDHDELSSLADQDDAPESDSDPDLTAATMEKCDEKQRDNRCSRRVVMTTCGRDKANRRYVDLGQHTACVRVA